jgi:hypothetical protein
LELPKIDQKLAESGHITKCIENAQNKLFRKCKKDRKDENGLLAKTVVTLPFLDHWGSFFWCVFL